MNLNKTEKLLAARKKLKEFQLNKKIQTQEALNKQQNETKQTNLQNNIIQEQKNESEDSQNNAIAVPKETFENALPFIDSNNVHGHMDISNASINQGISIVEKTITANDKHNNETPKTISPVKEALQHENACIETTTAQQIYQNDHHVEVWENLGVSTLPNISSDESSALQKEHLLQMASAVANVLTDNSEQNLLAVENDLTGFNQVLTSRLQEQKQTINQLHIQIAQYSSRISELEAVLATKDAEFDERLVREVNPLKEQLQIHTQTTGILIAEKAELSAALTKSQMTAKQNAEEIEELSGKVKSSQFRITELEKELISIKNNNEDMKKAIQHVQHEYDDMHHKYTDLRKDKEDLELEVSELKQKLNLKNTDLINLQQQLQEKAALLSLNEIKIQQLTNNSEMQMNESQHHTVTMLEQQLAQMRETLKTVNDEKDETNKQYQNYVRQLDMQHTKIVNELEEKQKVINELETKEQSYIQRLSDLEKQLQCEKERIEALLPLQEQKDRIDELTKNLDELTLEQERLHIVLNDKDMEIKALTAEIQELKDVSDQNVEASKLAQALESEQLGASRALSQNQQLKQQLNEMHDAFILLSNTKLDLTEQLQAERSIGRKLNAHLNKIENELTQVREQLTEKDSRLMELEKEKLQNAQITDQMQHYQAQSQHAHTLQHELQNALATIESLKKQNMQLIEKLNQKEQKEISDSEASNVQENLMIKTETEETIKTIDENTNDVDASINVNVPQSESSLSISEPVKKLEDRFKETMEKVAELTDENQRLEHLVLQLQGETETIGEYITLYQKQRAVLQERAKEREQAYRQLIEQRNQQQEQLHKLKSLIIDLMKKKSITQNDYDACVANHTGNTENVVQSDNDRQDNNVSTLAPIENETTSQLLDLLTEIKDCKDTSCTLEPELHLCPWCSGKLITV